MEKELIFEEEREEWQKKRRRLIKFLNHPCINEEWQDKKDQ